MHHMKDHSLFYKAKWSLLVCGKVNSSFPLFFVGKAISIITNRKIDILELKLKTLGNYSLDENRRQTFDCSAKKYLYESFLERLPINLTDNEDALKAYKEDQRSIGWCF